MLLSLPQQIQSLVISYLPQRDLLVLAQVCQPLSQLALQKLYDSISISQTKVIRSEKWYLDCQWTDVSGGHVSERPDKRDYLLYLKLVVLLDTIKTRPDLAALIKRVHIYDAVFHGDDQIGVTTLHELTDALREYCTNLECLIVDDDRVGNVVIPSLTHAEVSIADIGELNILRQPLRSLTLNIPRYSNNLPKGLCFPQLEELTIHDYEQASLQHFTLFQNVASLRKLSLNHIHGSHDYNTTLRDLTTIPLEHLPLEQLTHLELAIGCQESGCSCLHDFYTSLAARLTNLTHLSVRESTYVYDHYLTEDFDLATCQFLLNFTDRPLSYFSIRHNPPLNGLKLPNNVEGNYIRRRTLWEKTLPQLRSLRTLVAPGFLGVCSCYEILVSDLVWNGCECDACTPVLLKFDKYLMDHQYYDIVEGEFKDMLTCQLFGVMGRELLKRIPDLLGRNATGNNAEDGPSLGVVKGGINIGSFSAWSDLDWLKEAPRETQWDFHSGYDHITCFDDMAHCEVDGEDFDRLSVCVAHFLRGYVEWFTKECPGVTTIVLNGVYFCNGQIVYD